MIIYIAGLYSGNINENIANARKAAIGVWESGNVAICPHLNTAHFEIDASLDHDDYIEGDLKILARCDAILMLHNWKASKGAKIENQFAMEHKIPIFYYPDIPPVHPLEKECPLQVNGFIDVIMGMYRLHLRKNMDYSPMNVQLTGEPGLVTRIWDKTSRLLSLSGFRAQISNPTFSTPKTPNNEAKEDTYFDLALYGVIGILYRFGLWGK
jgi:hypothetical protein